MSSCPCTTRHYSLPSTAGFPRTHLLEKCRGTGASFIELARSIPFISSQGSTWLGRNFAEGRQKQEGEEKAGGGAWQRGDPACERTPLQPDPLRSQSRHALTTQALSSHPLFGACQTVITAAVTRWRRDQDFSSSACLFFVTAAWRLVPGRVSARHHVEARARGCSARPCSTSCRLDCPDWGITPLRWKWMG